MIVDIKIKGVWLKVDIIGISGGGGWEDLTANTPVDLAGFILNFTQNGDDVLILNPNTNNGQSVVIGAKGGTLNGEAKLSLYSNDDDGGIYGFNLRASDGTNDASIVANAAANTLAYTAGSHNFTGKLNNNTLQEFADDAAAVTGGLVPGDFYYTEDSGSGFLKVVLPGV